MTKPIVRDPIYRRRRFDAEIIELCVRWYITYRLSYRDLVAMMAERGIVVSHTNDSSLGDSLCARVREAMESLRAAGEFVPCFVLEFSPHLLVNRYSSAECERRAKSNSGNSKTKCVADHRHGTQAHGGRCNDGA
jgi:spermidine synthase